MSTPKRLALVAFVLFLAASAVATFAPTSPEGATCGNWVAPEWKKGETQDLLDEASATADELGDLTPDSLTSATYVAQRSYALCSDSLSTRRTLALVFLGLAIVAPAGMLFVARGSAREDRRPA